MMRDTANIHTQKKKKAVVYIKSVWRLPRRSNFTLRATTTTKRALLVFSPARFSAGGLPTLTKVERKSVGNEI